MKRFFTILLCLVAVVPFAWCNGAKEDASVEPEIVEVPEKVVETVVEDAGDILVYAKVPADWKFPCVWAWDKDGKGAFDSWPGGMMDPDPQNEGWYYIWVPSNMVSVIINANDGTVQTSDLPTGGKNIWITVADDKTAVASPAKITAGELPEYAARYTVWAQVPESWNEPGVWAWEDPSGRNAFQTWPGRVMKDNGNGWFKAMVPEWCNCVIINADGGSVQTADIKELDPADMWITVAEDGSFELTYDDPTIPKVADITVYAKVPEGWTEPCLWAWSHPDGTNAFSAWPGEALKDEGDGWYSITAPGWINSVIINANGGTVQTTDLRVDAGKDVYVTVVDAENASFAYER